MSGSERAFQKVKAILGKLDRSIEEARERRLHTTAPAAPASPVQPAQPQQAAPPGMAQRIPAQQKAPASPGSIYGRARPIPPSGLGNGGSRWGT